MPNDPYVTGVHTRVPYAAKSDVTGTLCAVLTSQHQERGLQLIPQPSRAVPLGAVHEIVRTNESGVKPNSTVDRVFSLGFVAVDRPGVILAGDRVTVGSLEVGQVAGFDGTHYPNHYNVVLIAPPDDERSGAQLPIELGDAIAFVRTAPPPS